MLVSKILLFGAFFAGGALVGVPSEDGSASESTLNSYFYEFVGDQTDINDVQNTAMYQREDPGCSQTDGELCGIYLPNDAAPHANPSSSDLSQYEDELWTSAQNSSSEIVGVIEMKE